jgi:hypothetical protein
MDTTCSLFFLETQSRQKDLLPVAIAGNVFVSAPILQPTHPLQKWSTLNAVTF